MGNMGISNQISAGSLMTSTKAINFGKESQRPKQKPYEGIDNKDYIPESSFYTKEKYQSKLYFTRQNMPGVSIGKGEKSDFTKEQRKLPGPNQYQDREKQSDFLSEQLSQSLIIKQNKLLKGSTLGFAEKSDFTRNQRGMPGSNIYKVDNYHIQDQDQKIKTNFGLGEKSDFTKSQRGLPGPNKYQQPAYFLSQEQSFIQETQYGHGMLKGYAQPKGERYDFTKNTMGFPSPSHYKNNKSDFLDSERADTQRVLKGIGGVKGSGLGKGQKSDFTKSQLGLPGPNQYQSLQNLSQFQSKKIQELKAHIFGGRGMMKGSSFGRGPRSDFTKEQRKIPGPGAYDKPFFSGAQAQFDENNKFYRSRIFSDAQKQKTQQNF